MSEDVVSESAPVEAMDTAEDVAHGDADEGKSVEDQDEGRSVPVFEADPVVKGKRERKSIARFAPPEAKEKEAFKVEAGQGEPLGDNPTVEYHISRHKADEWKLTHRVLFGVPGKLKDVKKNVRLFSGLPATTTDDVKAKRRDLLNRMYMAPLKDFCTRLDIEASGKKDDIIDSIFSWMENPKPSGRAGPQEKKAAKRKRSAKKKTKKTAAKAKAKKAAPKGPLKPPMTASQFYAKQARKEFKTDNPDATAAEIMKGLKKQWKKLSSKDQAPFKKKALADAKRYQKDVEAREVLSDSSEDEDDDDDNVDVDSEDEVEEKKPKKKPAKKAPAKAPKSPKKKAKEAEPEPMSSDESSSDDEPLVNEGERAPSQVEIRDVVTKILSTSELREMTKKKVRASVQDHYGAIDVSDHKEFINDVIKAYVADL